MVTLLIGKSGSGKSSCLKDRFLNRTPPKGVKPKETLCYALMKKDLGDFPYEKNFNIYVRKAASKNNTKFFVDEAKTAIPKEEPRPASDEWDLLLITWFLNARKCNNQIFIVFHMWREVPLWLLGYVDFILRFNTNDQIDRQKTRFSSYEKIVDSFEAFKQIPMFEYDEIKVR